LQYYRINALKNASRNIGAKIRKGTGGSEEKSASLLIPYTRKAEFETDIGTASQNKKGRELIPPKPVK
jgi:ribonuclease HIII